MNKIQFILFYVLLFPGLALTAQTNISGVINTYTPVTAILNTGCASTVTVVSAAGYTSGDKVLIIQMKGAVIDSTNSALFGNVTSLNSSGNYEYARIASINGNNILLNNTLIQSYFIPGFVQLIKVPEYTDATIVSTLQAQPWNGTIGGVLSFFVSGTVMMNADINVSGQGFRGGNISNNPDGGCGTGSPDFFYSLTQPGSFSWNFGGAMKGEGITVLNDERMAGKGKLANGGGGGNKHNHGGGGGGNFTSGGQGGEELQGCPIDGNMGIGGLSLSSTIQSNKLFLGGGGGCGDYNNAVGSNGANGGGMVIIHANSIVANGHTIQANGDDETIIGGGIADGVGGGGGGGTIFLDVLNYTGNLLLQANGGSGGDQDPTYGCVGTGGGGGTGAVLTSQSSFPASVSITTLPGRAGIFLPTNSTSCAGSNYYATPGQANVSGPVFGLQLPEGSAIGVMNVNLGNDTALCAGDILQLNPNISNASYVWQDGSTLPVFNVSVSGLYWVRISSGLCSGGDSITVSYSPRPVVELGNDTTICAGETLTLNQNGVASGFLWQDNSTAQTYQVTQAGLYILNASNNNCHVKDSILISYVNLNINLGNDTSLCTGDVLQLQPNINNVSYLWQDGSTQPAFSVTSQGLYWAQVSSGTCTASDSILVTYFPKPFIELGNDTTLCTGESLILNQNGVAANFLWQDNSTTQTYLVTQDGLYIVDANNNNCHTKDSIWISYVNLNFDIGNDTIVCAGDEVAFSVFCASCAYLWNTGSTSNLISAHESGVYSVSVQSVCGTSSDSVHLTTENCSCVVYVPNAFTPNGDGNNEELLPFFKCNLVFYRLKIFNRWGEKVFESNNAYAGWDGTYKNKNCPPGVYVYALTYSGDEGIDVNTYNLKGSITLIR